MLRKIGGALERRRNGERLRRPGLAALPFIIEEEESLVPADGAAQRAAEDVVAQLRLDLGAVLDGREKARSVQLIVPQVLVGASMELVRARFGGFDDHSAGRSAILGRVVVAQDFDLRDDL